MKTFKDHSGKIYNNLQVLSISHRSKSGIHWSIKCHCGKVFVAVASNLQRRKSCGCIKSKIAIENSKKSIKWLNRKDNEDLYRTWSNLKRRCLNTTDIKYNRYGGRGIKIYKLWIKNFDKFAEDILNLIGKRPNKKYSLDRINNDGNYEPGNLRWATSSEQIQNSSKAKMTLKEVNKIKSSNKSNKQLAKQYNVKIKLINRILSGETWK